MKIVLERDAALNALGLVARVAERKTTIPILTHVLVTAGKNGRVTLTGTNLDRWLTVQVAGGCTKPGAITVNAANLLNFVRATPGGGQVEMEQKEEHLIVRAGRARVSLPTLPADDFPGDKGSDGGVEIPIAGDVLAAAIGKVAHAQSHEETRFYLNGFYLHRHADTLRLVATDGHRMAVVDLPSSQAAPDGLEGVIVPRQSAGELQRIAAEAADQDVTLEITEDRLTCRHGDVTLSTKLVEGTFPDYERVIPTQNDCRFTTSREAFEGAVARCASLRDKATHAVALDATKDGLGLRRKLPDAGEVSDEVDANLKGSASSTGFNSEYMAQALAALEGSKSIEVEFTPGGPILIRDEADRDSHLQVVMAMRV